MNIIFQSAIPEELPTFRENIKKIFSIAVIETFGPQKEEVITDDEIDESLHKENAHNLHIIADGKKIGSISFVLNKDETIGHVELFFIYPECHSKGIGRAVWTAIESKFPQVGTWTLITPYFEKRNINFYVNKCGFHIVEFVNKYHKSDTYPDYAKDSDEDYKHEYFIFEKQVCQPK